MSPLPSPLASGDWSAEIGRVAELFMNGNISIFDPGTPGTYDALTDALVGGTPDALVLTSKARIQQLRSPAEGNTGGEWVTKRAIRVQIPLSAGFATYPDSALLPDGSQAPGFDVYPSFGAQPLRKGLIVRVNDGARSPWLVEFAFTVLSAVNSSHAAVCTIECVSELTPVPAVA